MWLNEASGEPPTEADLYCESNLQIAPPYVYIKCVRIPETGTTEQLAKSLKY